MPERRVGDSIELVLEGDLDIAVVQELTERLQQVEAQAQRLVLDLRRLTYLDSSGIRVLMGCHSRLQAAGQPTLTLVVGDGPVMRGLQLTEVNKVFSLVTVP